MELLVSLRWPNGVECPRCGSKRVIRIKPRPWNWVCKSGAQWLDKSTGKVSECPKKTGYRFSLWSGRYSRTPTTRCRFGSRSST